jgi:hypothetical protein
MILNTDVHLSRRRQAVRVRPESIKEGETEVGNIDQDELGGATSSAGIQTAESFGGERQATLPKDLRRTIRRLHVRVH